MNDCREKRGLVDGLIPSHPVRFPQTYNEAGTTLSTILALWSTGVLPGVDALLLRAMGRLP